MALNLKRRRPADITFADELVIDWGDGLVVHYPFFALRDACPCAGCVDEMSGKKTLDPARIAKDIHIRSCATVGNYALRIDWSDGHDTGIYSFRYLRDMHETETAGGEQPGKPYVVKH
jgi:DUF971 family protein